jgi:type VI secretion system secreted protein Hcp
MNRRVPAVALLLAVVLLLPATARAAYDAFLKLEGVPGESTDPKHGGWIEVESYQLDALRSSATGGAGAGKVHVHDFSFTKKVDKASPVLMKACTKGQHFPTATLSVRKAGGGQQEYLVIKLQDVVVSSYRTGGGAGAPTETMVLNAAQATIEGAGHPPAVLGARKLQVEPGGVQVAAAAPRITGASASAPAMGLAVAVTITSTGPCTSAFVDYGDGSIAEGHTLTGTSTTLAAHTYPTAGAKTIKVGGRGAPYWPAPQKAAARPNECTGWAPEVKVTLNSGVMAAPAIRR